MTLTGAPFLVLVAVLAGAVLIAGAAWLPRTRRSVGGFVTRLLTQLGASVMVLLLVAVVLNNENGWYANWGDLFGSSTPSVQRDQGGASAAKALTVRPSGPGLTVPAA